MSVSYDEFGLLQNALSAFKACTGIELTVIEAQPGRPGNHADFLLGFPDGETLHPLVAECKQTVDRPAGLSRVRSTLEGLAALGSPLLVTHYLSPALAQQCRKLQLNFLDTAGNAYLKLGHALIFISGHRPPTTAAPISQGSTVNAAALRIVFAIASAPELLGASYRELSTAASVSLGAIGPVLKDLQYRGLISGQDSRGERHILNPQKLRAEWSLNYPARLRPSLKPITLVADDASWWTRERDPSDFLWSGEVAESMTSGVLKPATQTLYVRPGHTRGAVLQRLAAKHRLRRQSAGPVELLDSFWNFETPATGMAVVPDLLIYADLIGIGDSRTAEAAAAFRNRYFHDPDDTAE
jgi:hypothetical protein